MKNNYSGTILIVEDEENLGSTLNEYLCDIGFKCHLATNGAEATQLFDQISPTIVLMDIGLPDISGLELAKQFIEKRSNFVLLFLSALNDPDTRVEGLEIGAIDYITKPFALKELTLRLGRILKAEEQTASSDESEVQLHDLKIWFKRYQVQRSDGTIQELSQKECEILRLLFDNKNEAVTRDQIIEKVWGENKFPTNRTVDNYIVSLRKWTETSFNKNVEIQSIRGIGYKLFIK